MLPTLIQIGPIVISSLGVLIGIGFLFGSFVFWKRGKKEYFKEEELMDSAILTAIAGILGARLGYVFLNLPQFKGHFWRIFDVVGYPGFWQLSGIVSAFLMLWYFGKKKGWDFFKVADIFCFGLTLFLIFLRFGLFLDGSYYGVKTDLPWGLRFPGLIEKRHPIQIYEIVFFFIFYQWLFWVEKNYRTFEWYQGKKGQAKEGFLLSSFFIFFGLSRFAVEFIRVDTIYWNSLSISQWTSLLFLVSGLIILFTRSGQELNIDMDLRGKKDKDSKKENIKELDKKKEREKPVRKRKKVKKKRFKTGVDAKK